MRKLFSFLVLITFLLIPSTVMAETINTNINGINYSFNIGDGADGNVVFRVNPSNPTQGQMLVNGAVVATSSTTTTVRNNIFQSYNLEKTYIVFDLQNVMTHLPVTKTYPAYNRFYDLLDTTEFTFTNSPRFNNLTIGDGILLQTSNRALIIRVRENLVIEGILATAHGAGGAGGGSAANGANGQDAGGDIIISAKNLIVAPNGSNASHGAIMAGWGGGGGGGGPMGYTHTWITGHGAHGGRGGSVYIFAETIPNNGEIRAGNGGGGGGGGVTYWNGVGDNPNYRGNGGNGGLGGNLYLVVLNITQGRYFAGYGGGNGGSGAIWWHSDWEQYIYSAGGGGYGSGGGGARNDRGANGGAAGLPGEAPWNGSIGSPGTAGRNGAGGLSTIAYTWWSVHYYGPGGNGAGNSHGANVNGTLKILVKENIQNAEFFTGYSIASLAANEKMYIVVDNDANLKYNARHASGIAEIIVKGDLRLTGNTSISRITVTRDLHLSTHTMTLQNITIGGNLYTDNTILTIGQLTSNGDVFINNGRLNNNTNIGSISSPVNNRVILNNVDLTGTITIFARGDVTFRNNPNYFDAANNWWMGRTVNVNGIRVKGGRLVGNTNAAGTHELDLTHWVSLYTAHQSPVVSSLIFRIERKTTDEVNWSEFVPVIRTLTGTPSYVDNKTIIGIPVTYIAAFKRTEVLYETLGYIRIEQNSTPPMLSEGGGLDEVPPVINFFTIENNQAKTNKGQVSIRVSASDNRTRQVNLKIRFKRIVEDVPLYYYHNGTSFVQGNSWGTYQERFENFPVVSGLNEIVLEVSDESLNIATQIKFIYMYTEGETIDPEVLKLIDPLAPIEREIFNLKTEIMGISDSSLTNRLARIEQLLEGTISFQNIRATNNATVTRTHSINLILEYTNATHLRVKVNNNPWSDWVSLSGYESIGFLNVSGLENGFNIIQIEIRNEFNKTASRSISIFKIK